MTQPGRDCHLLTLEAASALSGQAVGKLVPVLTPNGAVVPVTVLDNFDQSLRRSGRLLLDTGAALELFGPDGRSLTQPARARGALVADLAEGPVRQALADLSPLRALLPMHQGTAHRAVLAFVDSDRKTQVRAHLVTLTGPEGAAVMVTLQGLRGYDKALAEVRARVNAVGGTGPSAARLQDRVFPAPPGYDAKPEIDFGPGATAIDAANDIIYAYIPVARANEPGIVADLDTEFLHDYRVALRKIRSVLSLFQGVYAQGRTDDLKARFSALMAATGRLRDLDVYLLDRQRHYDLLPASLHPGLDTKFRMLAAERKAEQVRLARQLRSKRHDRAFSDLEHLFARRRNLPPGPNAERSAHDFACTLIWKRHRKISRIAAALRPDTSDTEVHALRIHCKKLRYLMEFFAPVFPGPAFKSLLRPLKALQDNLGRINDCAVQQVSLQAFLRAADHWPDGVDLEVAQSVGALTSVLHRRQAEERARTAESLAAFTSPQTEQTFRDLFHAGKDHP